MERIDKPILKNYLPLTLFLDDLESIDQILKESGSEVSFETEGFRFQSVGELVSHIKQTRLKALDIRARSPYASIELTNLWARLYVASSEKGAGIFYKLDQILSARVRKLNWLYSYPVLFGFMIFLNALYLTLKIDRRLLDAISAITFAWSLWVTWVVFFVRSRSHSTIVLKHLGEEGSFIERNRDSLAVAIIAATIGALIGVVGTNLFNYLSKK